MAQQGLFDTRSQEQILNDRWREQQAGRMQMAQQVSGTGPGEQAAGALGGLLAGGLGKRFAPPTLTPEEQTRTTAIQSATERTKSWRAENPNASVEDIGLITTKHMGEELLKNGDMQGLQFAQAWAQQERARRQGKLEIERLEGTVADEAQERKFWQVTNTLKTVWPKNAEFGEEGFEAFIDENGNAQYIDENGQQQTLLRGQYTRYDPQRPTTGRGSATEKPSDHGWTSTQIGQVRQLGAMIPRTANALINMQKALKDSVQVNGAVNFLGSAGSAQSWVSDVANSMSAMARSVGSFFSVGEKRSNLATEAEALNYVNARPELVEALAIHMPEAIKADTRAKARWAAAATQLAFARGQSLEPGQRNMSDQDFQVQIENIAALTTDPEAFRQVSIQNFQSDWDNYQFMYESADPYIQNLILAPGALKRVEEARAMFDTSFAPDFGDAGAPGPGIVESDDEVVNRFLGN